VSQHTASPASALVLPTTLSIVLVLLVLLVLLLVLVH
jgi:hypothetical protein